MFKERVSITIKKINKVLLMLGLFFLLLSSQVNADENSRLLKLLKKDYQEYKEAVFKLANENEYSCFYKRGQAYGPKKINIAKADYIKQTYEGPHLYFYHSDDFNYAIPQTVNPQTKKRTFAPFVLEFSGKYEKYLDNTKRIITNTKDRINLKVILTNNSIQQYNFNKKNNEIRVIYENEPEFKKQNINKLDFIFQCNPIKINIENDMQESAEEFIITLNPFSKPEF
tara:strand:+ start:1388 stop:2068 length:681 start_codon:yes stop_codon:yes gene_type:complete